MLVTNPLLRANLEEISNHPWMTKGHSGPPQSHLPKRNPLRPDMVFDSEVIKGMTGFEFGKPHDIERKLRELLNSPSYLTSLAEWDRRNLNSSHKSETDLNSFYNISNYGNAHVQHTPHHHRRFSQQIQKPIDVHKDLPTSISASNALSNNYNVENNNTSRSSRLSKRFSGFDFYKRKLTGSSVNNQSNTNDQQQHILINEKDMKIDPTRPYLDPTAGFHPL